MDASAALDRIPRMRLCHLPTPVGRLERLEAELGGPEVYVKRDDLTGLALGGNKGRKLEFLLAEARAAGSDLVLTTGGLQSNCCRQLALAASALGMEAHLFLRGDRPELITGNLLVAELGGARVHCLGTRELVETRPQIDEFIAEARRGGRRPFEIPLGGSNAAGTLGYVAAAGEIARQQEELGLAFDWIFTASASGGTHAGLALGARLFGLGARVAGVWTGRPDRDARGITAGLVAAAADRLGLDCPLAPEDLLVLTDYQGEWYAVPTPAGREAVETLARLEGLILDNTYTGKAMSALIDWARTGRIRRGEKVLFVHTGGQVGLFA